MSLFLCVLIAWVTIIIGFCQFLILEIFKNHDKWKKKLLFLLSPKLGSLCLWQLTKKLFAILCKGNIFSSQAFSFWADCELQFYPLRALFDRKCIKVTKTNGYRQYVYFHCSKSAYAPENIAQKQKNRMSKTKIEDLDLKNPKASLTKGRIPRIRLKSRLETNPSKRKPYNHQKLKARKFSPYEP